MSDYLKGFFGTMLALILMVAAPVCLMKIRMDTVSTYEAMSEAALFSEEIRQEGVITKRELKVFAGRMATLGFGIDVAHEEKVVEGYVDNGIFVKTGEGYYSRSFSEIDEACEKNGEYDLKIGDRLVIGVRGKMRSFTVGGLVLNEAD